MAGQQHAVHTYTHTRRPCFAQCKHLPRPSNWALITLDGKTLVAIFFVICSLDIFVRHSDSVYIFNVGFLQYLPVAFDSNDDAHTMRVQSYNNSVSRRSDIMFYSFSTMATACGRYSARSSGELSVFSIKSRKS